MKVTGAALDCGGSQISIKPGVFAPGKPGKSDKKRRGKCVFRGPEAVAEQILPHSHVLLIAWSFDSAIAIKVMRAFRRLL